MIQDKARADLLGFARAFCWWGSIAVVRDES